MRRVLLIPFLITIAVFAAAGGLGYLLYDHHQYYRTDDALVSGRIVRITAPTSGLLTSLSVKRGDLVIEGQTVALVRPPAGVPEQTLASPVKGIVVQTLAVQGENVAAGVPIVQVTDSTTPTVMAYVDEGALNDIKVGQEVDIHVDAYPNVGYTGRVQQIVQATAGEFSLLPSQDNASGNYTKVAKRIPVVISLDGAAGKDLVPGLNAEVTIHIN